MIQLQVITDQYVDNLRVLVYDAIRNGDVKAMRDLARELYEVQERLSRVVHTQRVALAANVDTRRPI